MTSSKISGGSAVRVAGILNGQNVWLVSMKQCKSGNVVSLGSTYFVDR